MNTKTMIKIFVVLTLLAGAFAGTFRLISISLAQSSNPQSATEAAQTGLIPGPALPSQVVNQESGPNLSDGQPLEPAQATPVIDHGIGLPSYGNGERPEPGSPGTIPEQQGSSTTGGARTQAVPQDLVGMHYYYDWSSFTAGAPGLPVEDFEDGNVTPGNFVVCPAPLDSTSNNACFTPGNILPGIRFSDAPGPDPTGLVLLGSGQDGNPNKAIITNSAPDLFVINFTQPANAIGFEVQSHYNADTATISIYAVDGSLLDTRYVAATNSGTFFGFISDYQIGSITITTLTNEWEGVDNVAFGLLTSRVTFYTDGGVFNSDYPGLPMEDFEKGNIAPGGVVTCPAPLDYTSNNTCFTPGDILEGIRFSNNPVPDSAGIALAGAGFFGYGSKAIYANHMTDSLDIYLFQPVNTVGFDLISMYTTDVMLVTVYGPAGQVLWQASPTVNNTGSFFGFNTEDQITRINLYLPSSKFEGVDNLRFGWVSDRSHFFTNRGTFDKALPGLKVEDFEKGIVANGTIVPCPAPLDSTNNDACFTSGSIQEGIRFTNNPIPKVDGLALLGAGFWGNSSKYIISNYFTNTLDIIFTEPVNAVGFDVTSIFNNGPEIISAYGPGGKKVLETEVVGTSNGSNFWGMHFNQQITRINIYSPSNQAEGLDNIAFGWRTNLQTYSSRSSFQANFTHLAFEDFEDGNVAPGNAISCSAPLDSTSNNVCFTPGDIPVGIRFMDNYGPDIDGLALLGVGSWGNSSKWIDANYFVDSFDIYFTKPVNTVGFDLTSLFGSKIESVTLYGVKGEMLFRFQGASSINGIFWGVHSPVLISRINIDSNTGDGEGVDNISFGFTTLTKLPIIIR